MRQWRGRALLICPMTQWGLWQVLVPYWEHSGSAPLSPPPATKGRSLRDLKGRLPEGSPPAWGSAPHPIFSSTARTCSVPARGWVSQWQQCAEQPWGAWKGLLGGGRDREDPAPWHSPGTLSRVACGARGLSADLWPQALSTPAPPTHISANLSPWLSLLPTSQGSG